MEEKIRNAIRKAIAEERKNFVIYPFGEQGRVFKHILNSEFDIREVLIIDNGKKDQDDNIKCFEEIDPNFWMDCVIFIVSDHREIYFELRSQVLQYVPKENVLDVLTNEWGTIDVMQLSQNKDRVKVFFNPSLRFHHENTVEALGNNTGNLVYIEAAREQLNYDIEARFTKEWVNSSLGRKNIISLMPASNFVSENTVWCKRMIPILEKTDMQFTFVGLGAQAALDETPKSVVMRLSDRQKYVFKLVSERALSIGVRGEFTAECLAEMGIKNVEVIGCPSFYQYIGQYPILAAPTGERILYTADKSKKKIYELAEQSSSNLICQNHEDCLGGEETIFYDFKEWNDYIKNSKFTFAFGSRFHGNMMALRNGIPTLWIVHDWRTLELVQTMGLPHINYYDEKFRKIKYLEELFEYCDYSEVYKRYPQLNKKYCNFMRKNFDENFRK